MSYLLSLDKPLPVQEQIVMKFNLDTDYIINYSLHRRQFRQMVRAASPFEAWKKFKSEHRYKPYWAHIEIDRIV